MYFLGSDGRMMALDVELASPRFGVSHSLFQTWLEGDATTEHFAVTSDGQRFLMADQESGRTEFTVVLNWRSPLARR